jgi:outer membrane receptor protein involved in Fe transport
MRRVRLYGFPLVLMVGATVVHDARAQQTASASSSDKLDEIVVTARKREESLLDVPLSVTALTAADLERAAVTEIRDITRLTPSFNFPDLGARYIDSPVIRGVPGNDADATKQSASFFVDGIYVSGSITSLNMDDVQRVEVIKGPQSALFGRATFAGAINFISKEPTNDYAGRLSATGAEDSEYELTASHSGPLVDDRLYYRVNGRYWTRGGEYRNAGLPRGLEIGDQATWNLGGSLLWRPTEAVRVKARAEFSHDDDGPAPIHKKTRADQNCTFNRPTPPLTVAYICGPISFDPNRVGGVFDELIAEGIDPGLQRDLLRSSLQVDWDFGPATLSGILAYNDEDMQRNWDVVFDLVKNPFFNGPGPFGGAVPGTSGAQIVNDWQFRDTSLELRLASNGDGRLSWIVGAFATELNQLFGRTRGAVALDRPNRRKVEGRAVFAQAGLRVTDTLRFSAEARYQEEKLQRLDATTRAVLVLGGGVLADETYNAFLPRVTLDWKPAPNVTLYAQYAEGNKPGDFNTAANVPAEFVVLDEEDLEAFEVGAKASLLDGRLSGAVALYKYDLSNQQLRDVTPTFQILTRNTGASESRGAELELTWLATDALTLRTALGYVDSEFVNNPQDQRNLTIRGTGNANGLVPRNTPAFTAALVADYEAPLSGDRYWFLRGDYSYRSKIFADETNVNWGEPLELVNVRLGLRTDAWRAELFAKNLFDADEPIRVGNASDFSTFPAGGVPEVVSAIPVRGRQVGVRVSYDF